MAYFENHASEICTSKICTSEICANQGPPVLYFIVWVLKGSWWDARHTEN